MNAKAGIYRACNWCGKQYYVPVHRAAESNFCSMSCVYKGRPKTKREGVNAVCEHCGKEYYVTQGRKDNTRFCSMRCSGLGSRSPEGKIAQAKAVTKHGMAGTSEHGCWEAMKARCAPTGEYYPFGVRVCEEWRKDFMAFYNYMGPRPSTKHSLDRYPNAKGHYEPGNVRWATPKEQGWSKVGKLASEETKQSMSDTHRERLLTKGTQKLTVEDVREIRALKLSNGSYKEKAHRIKELSARFGVSDYTIRDIQTGKSWSWLE